MKHTDQDIYGTQHASEPDAETHAVSTSQEVWRKEVRLFFWRRFFFGTAILLLVTFLGTIFIVIYRGAAPEKERIRPTPKLETPAAIAPVPTPINMDPRELFMTDELSELADQPLPEKGDLPLEAQWVKQAAHQLVLAEKAEQAGNREDAVKDYNKALWIFPDMRGVRRRIGLLKIQAKDFEGAAEAFSRAVQEEPLSPGLANNLGVAYLQLEQYDKAEEAFQRALRLKPDYTAARLNLATLYIRTGKMGPAAEQLQQYRERDPHNLRAMYAYAYTLLQLKQWAKAVEILRQLARADPASAPIQFRLAQALAHVRRPGEALQALRRGAALTDAAHALQWMSRDEFALLKPNPGFEQLRSELKQKSP